MKRDYLIGLLVAIFLACVLSPLASSFPDGLERVAEDHGFLAKTEGAATFPSPIPDYSFPGVGSSALATSMAGLLGTIVVYLLVHLVGRLTDMRGKHNEGTRSST
ncbi:MAG TPA: hypothetical protein GX509_11305 [Firmicutes bacterium]|nr:hypothetical protein [Bacillota bacterium]HHY99312.1 hypothetical protein [Bacillota bacterium]